MCLPFYGIFPESTLLAKGEQCGLFERASALSIPPMMPKLAGSPVFEKAIALSSTRCHAPLCQNPSFVFEKVSALSIPRLRGDMPC